MTTDNVSAHNGALELAASLVELEFISDVSPQRNGEIVKRVALHIRALKTSNPGPWSEPLEGTAALTYKLVADNGYEAEATYHNITPERYGHMVGALNGTLKLVTPEIEEALARLEGLDK